MSEDVAERESTSPRLRVLAGWLVAAGAVFGAGYTVMFVNGPVYLAQLVSLDLLSETDLFLPFGPGVWFLVTAGLVTVVMMGASPRRRHPGVRVGIGKRVASGLIDATVWWWSTLLVSFIPLLVIAVLLGEDADRAGLLMMLAVGPLIARCYWPSFSELLWPDAPSGPGRLVRAIVRAVRTLTFRAGKSPLPGDVWFAEVPFAEGGGSKDRPVLILGPSDHFTWEALMFTSADKQGRRGYFRSDTVIRGQRKSWLKVDRLVELKPRDLRVRAGAADLETLKAAQSARELL